MKKKIILMVKMTIEGDKENIDEYKMNLRGMNVVEDLGSDNYDLEVINEKVIVK